MNGSFTFFSLEETLRERERERERVDTEGGE
jgi:hypothetical protein